MINIQLFMAIRDEIRFDNAATNVMSLFCIVLLWRGLARIYIVYALSFLRCLAGPGGKVFA
jgi:hypothetical protein